MSKKPTKRKPQIQNITWFPNYSDYSQGGGGGQVFMVFTTQKLRFDLSYNATADFLEASHHLISDHARSLPNPFKLGIIPDSYELWVVAAWYYPSTRNYGFAQIIVLPNGNADNGLITRTKSNEDQVGRQNGGWVELWWPDDNVYLTYGDVGKAGTTQAVLEIAFEPANPTGPIDRYKIKSSHES